MENKSDFSIDPRLQADCIWVGKLQFCHVLMFRNTAVPWFILVPETFQQELVDLSDTQKNRLADETEVISKFAMGLPVYEKLNIASLGNVVSQLHVHVVVRHHEDYCWPQPVWGQSCPEPLSENALNQLIAQLKQYLSQFKQTG